MIGAVVFALILAEMHGLVRATPPGGLVKRTAVVCELASTKRHQWQFFTFLWPSWRYFARRPAEAHNASVNMDLHVFCEDGGCDGLPADCSSRTGERSSSLPQCHSTPMPPTFGPGSYTFGTSIDFMLSTEFSDRVLHSFPRYDYVLRLDADSILGPACANWFPPLDFAFGKGFMGVSATHRTLEEVARAYNLPHQGIHGMQSTIYLPRHHVLPIMRLLVNLTKRVYEEEFTAAKCAVRQCRWPDWHRGVSSLYGQNLALNALVPSMHPDMVTGRLDYGATGTAVAFEQVVAIHMLSLKHSMQFTKLDTKELCSSNRTLLPGLNKIPKRKLSRQGILNQVNVPLRWPDIAWWFVRQRSIEGCALVRHWSRGS